MQVHPWLVLALVGGLLGADQVRSADATVEVVSKRALMSAPAVPAVGGGFVTGGDLFTPDGATRVGEGFSHCGVVAVSVDVPPAVIAHCTSTFRLPDGEIHLSSMRRYKSIAMGFTDTPMAIVGGTGAYAAARGEAKATRSNSADVGYRFVFTLVD
ncbi:allene oxide cyclase barrel-like domain-containing protein [Saccharothrix isguenensis]